MMHGKMRYFTIAVGILVLLLVQSTGEAQKTKLTQAAVEQSLQLPGPDIDDVLASQIRSRGLNFTLTRKTMETLAASAKGKPHSIAALRELVVLGKGKIEVRTEPGSQVLLDGRAIGTAGADGLLSVQDILEGDHELITRRATYREANSRFSLDSNEVKQIALPMEFIGGYLTISTTPANAGIRLYAGQTTFNFSADSEMKLPSGSYTATVVADGYISQSRTFQVGTGEHHIEKYQLAVDLAAAKAKAIAGDQAGMSFLNDAIQRGESLSFNVRYTDSSWTREISQRDGQVTVSKSLISFQPTVGSTPFSVTPDKIVELVGETQKAGRIRLKVQITQNGKEETKSYEFYHPTTSISGFTIVCNQCDNSMNVLLDQLQEVRRLAFQNQMPVQLPVAGKEGDSAEARNVIDKLIGFMGGQSKVNSVRTMHQIYSVLSGGKNVRLEQSIVYPDKQAAIITVGNNQINVLVAPAGVFYSIGPRVLELPASLKKTYSDELIRDYINVLQHINDAAYSFSVSGKTKLGSTDATQIDVLSDGVATRWWISAEGQLLQQTYSEIGPTGPRTQTDKFLEWRDIDGLHYPSKVETKSTDASGQTATLQSMEINTDIDPRLFVKP